MPMPTTRVLLVGGFRVEVPFVGRPYCDCQPMEMGFTKRDDGAWVKPCCMRRTKDMFEKYGDKAID